ncbi:MAG: hypothetical protein WA210_12185 [Burkholderiaceae bacterium]
MAWSTRTLLIWLLVLAVPAQAAAAATMAFCGPNHHGGARAALAAQVAAAAHAHHGSATQSPHEHDGAAAQPDDDAAAAGSAATPGKFVQADAQKCSVCASCCSGAAILGTVVAVPALEVSPTQFIAVVPTVAAFSADGPERPPRVFLA